MSGKTDARDWFSSMTGQRVTAVEMAEILGVSRNAVNGRLKRGLDADDLISISRALNLSPIHALVELEKLTYGEVLDFLDGDGTLLASATPEQLVFRLAEESLPLSDQISLGAAAKARADQRDELAARRDVRPAHYDDGTVEEWDSSEPYAADSSPDETEERLERGEDPID